MRILFCLLFSFNCLAIDIIPIKKGEAAPDDGFFVPPSEMRKFRQLNEEKKLLEEKQVSFKDLALTNQQQIDIHKKQSSYYQEQVYKEQNRGMWMGTGGFILGVLTTGLISYATIKTLR